MVESIVTCWPPGTGVTAAILSTLVPLVSSVVSLYVHVLPTATGNGTELVEATDVEPLDPAPADVELLALALGELVPPSEPEPPSLQPVRIRPATAANPTAARAPWRSGDN